MANINTVPQQPYVLADHIVLDMINTVAKVNGDIVDYWQSSKDVINWLDKVANINMPVDRKFTDEDLLHSAKELREIIRLLVQAKKAGGFLSTDLLNNFLLDSLSWLSLEVNKSGELGFKKNYKKDTPKQILGPLAEAAVELLVTIDFNLVKRCEHEDCILWFYDKTKAHKRRWCSMAVCGNRHKVANFRKKQQ